MSIYIIVYLIMIVLFIALANYRFKVLRISAGTNGSYEEKIYGRQMKIFVVISCAMLIGVIGFRSEYQGIDLHNSFGTGYFYVYDLVCQDTILDIFKYFPVKRYMNFEIGYVLFNKLVSVISNGHQLLLVAVSLVSIVPVGYYIFRNSKNIWLSFMLYMSFPFFTSAYFSALRQGIAIGVIVLSYDFIKRRKFMLFMLMIILAFFFHKSAIVCIVAYPAYHLRINKRDTLVAGMVLLAIIYLLKEPLFIVLSQILSREAQIDSNGAINYFLFLTVLFAICTIFCNENNRELRGLRNLLWIACVSQAFGGVYMIATRVTWYFLPALMILLPNVLREIKVKEASVLRLLEWVIGMLAILLGLCFFRYNSVALSYPYMPFWV